MPSTEKFPTSQKKNYLYMEIKEFPNQKVNLTVNSNNIKRKITENNLIERKSNIKYLSPLQSHFRYQKIRNTSHPNGFKYRKTLSKK